MQIQKLYLYNFKNAQEETLTFSDGVNIIYGENASGKTNLLEAIFYFAAGKSFRGSKDKDLLLFGEEKAKAELMFENRAGRQRMGLTLGKGEKRALSVGGVRVQKLSEYLGLFRAVIFTPDHLHLVKGDKEFRRRFLDLAICQSFPRYASSLAEYGRLLAQKNALLKMENPDRALCEVYHERMASLAATITVNRAKYLENLQEAAKAFQSDMSGGKEELTLKYQSQALRVGAECKADAIRDAYLALYAEKLDSEIKKGFPTVGPQRDDFAICINGLNAKSFGSQGQQRSAVLALKLAEGELSMRLTGEYPVFLLDDILSELDAGRRAYILSKIGGKQVVLTGCETELFEEYGGCNKIFVEHGIARNV